MKRTEFIDRVARRARNRYGQDFTDQSFDQLIDEGLIEKGRRLGNDGKRPIYEFSCASYRRTLQIVRLRKKGIIRTNAIKVQLFVHGYSQPVWDVREPLHAEYVKAAKTLLGPVRSGYISNQRPIPPKHKLSFLQQIGVLDSRFVAAGLQLQDNLVIDALRNSTQRLLSDNLRGVKLEQMLKKNQSFNEVAKLLLPTVFDGMLLFSDGQTSTEEDIETLIRSADDSHYVQARRLFWILNRSQLNTLWNIIGNDAPNEKRYEATEAAVRTIPGQPSFTAFSLVQCLRFVRENHALAESLSTDESCDKILNLLEFLHANGMQVDIPQR